jgi:hypothetical protein
MSDIPGLIIYKDLYKYKLLEPADLPLTVGKQN